MTLSPADREAMRARAEAWLPLQGEHPINEEQLALDVLALLDALAAAEAESERFRLTISMLEQTEARALWQLREAVIAWDASLSEFCDGPERDAVREALGVSAHTQDKP